IPVPVLVGVRAGRRSETTACVYTTGLARFGRMDLERLDVEAPPAQLYSQMCDLVALALSSGTDFQPGQTLELGESRTLVTSTEQSPFTAQQVLRLTAGLDGQSAAGCRCAAGRGGWWARAGTVRRRARSGWSAAPS